MRISGAVLGVLVMAGALLAGPRAARAWDPSTTHQSMLQRAVLDSALHRRWMDQTGMQRGVFSPLRIDPARLSAEERRVLTLALRRSHAATGAQPLGGPGSCPGAGAPPSTRRLCVEGDLWEASAVGWMRLGVLAELVPRDRLLHHFTDLEKPESPTWSDQEFPRSVLRAKHRRSGGSIASGANRTLFEGETASAAAWIEDTRDPFAPPAMFEHLRAASTAASRAERDHHLAMALVGMGATLHVVQDLSVPAHARGDITAFFAQLSSVRGDRGLPLQEFARVTYGRIRLPGVVSLFPRGDQSIDEATGPSDPLALDLRGHLFGDRVFEGLVHFAGRRFFSETTLPSPVALDPELDPERAAAVLVEHAKLDASERDGATLRPWPSSSGYLVTRTGRPLAAFDTDEIGRTRLYLDRVVYRDQCAQLIPKAVEVSASILDLAFPGFPNHDFDRTTDILELELPEHLRAPELLTFLEDQQGRRTLHQRLALRPATRNRIVDLLPSEVPDNTRIILVVTGEAASGAPFVTEHALDLREDRPLGGESITPVQRGLDPAAPSEAPPSGRRTVPPGAAPTTVPGTPPVTTTPSKPEESPDAGAETEPPVDDASAGDRRAPSKKPEATEPPQREPANKAPVADEPAEKAPVADEPAEKAPVADEPAEKAPPAE